MKTTIHEYCFNIRNRDEYAQYIALKEKLSDLGLKCFESSHADGSHYNAKLDGLEVELETKHIFGDQWNTAPIVGISEKGLRVFDWAQDYEPNPNLKRGHWLEQTTEMQELRRNTYACGYCGKQEPAQKGNVFCPHCIGSETLKYSELYMTRMQSVENTKTRKPLSEAEKAHLLPIYKNAQLHGNTERDKARIAKKRMGINAEYEKVTRNAAIERDGLLWLMDHGVKTDNVIFYSHTGRFGFGWRRPVDNELKSDLLDIISEFPFNYDIVCADGSKLSS